MGSISIRPLQLRTEGLGYRVRRRVLRKYREWETALYARRILDMGSLVLPDFVVIGARKCGTTWLYENLRAHPDLFLVEGKGVEFFDKHFHRGIRFYSSRFTQGAKKIKGEVSASYSYMSVARIQCMRALAPATRLVLLIRNPIDRAWSQAYMHLLTETGRTLDAVAESEMRAYLTQESVMRAGLYSVMLENWLSVFPRAQLYVGLYEDVGARPEELMREIFCHIGASCQVDWSHFPLRETIIPPAGARFSHCDQGRGVQVVDYQSSDKHMPMTYREFLRELYRREIETLGSRYALPVQGWLNR